MRALTLCLAMATLPCAIGAQGAVRGVLFDSLRTGKPIAGAEVVLIGAGMRVRTDAAGRFRFVGVAAGSHEVAYFEPWLDSLGLAALRVPVTVRGAAGETVVALATPSRATRQRQLCGTELADGFGVALGEVRVRGESPLEGIIVFGMWSEAAVVATGLEVADVATSDTTDASGSFVLCGVPIGSAYMVRARGHGLRTDPLSLRHDDPFRRLDVTVGAGGGPTARITGTVRDAIGRPIIGARVRTVGDSLGEVVTDREGRFLLAQVPTYSTQIEVRAIGFMPGAVDVAPDASETASVAVTLEPVPPELAAVRVEAALVERQRADFELRRKRGLGYFITDSMLARLPVIGLHSVGSMVPRIGVTRIGREPVLTLKRDFGYCHPRYFVDGVDEGKTLREPIVPHQEDLLKRAKRIEVYTANQAPPQFTDFDGCGAVVIWTK